MCGGRGQHAGHGAVFLGAVRRITHPAPDIDWCRPNGVTDSSDRIVHQRLKALIEHLIDDRAPFQRIAAIYLLLDALVTAGKPVGRVDSAQRDVAMIKKGIEFINQRFDQPLSLAEVAGYIGVSYSWFSRQFKKVSRHNFKEYLTLVRLNKARTLLKDTRFAHHHPLATPAVFQEHKYLIAAFNKYCGFNANGIPKTLRFPGKNAIDSRLASGGGLSLPAT
ncbi:DNA-binding transcriptional regulator MelR [Cedecea neteri]|uniref:DNA-binding transcriptional regulator MelR n=1 Tax=Cedecea neteri TaxID=158822 RepID=A0A2X3IJE9_9ENTR|nr:DNA-binding transcriptional regulator MelR [Cedecea neteri]